MGCSQLWGGHRRTGPRTRGHRRGLSARGPGKGTLVGLPSSGERAGAEEDPHDPGSGAGRGKAGTALPRQPRCVDITVLLQELELDRRFREKGG